VASQKQSPLPQIPSPDEPGLPVFDHFLTLRCDCGLFYAPSAWCSPGPLTQNQWVVSSAFVNYRPCKCSADQVRQYHCIANCLTWLSQ
jgi:hypothetical protein